MVTETATARQDSLLKLHTILLLSLVSSIKLEVAESMAAELCLIKKVLFVFFFLQAIRYRFTPRATGKAGS